MPESKLAAFTAILKNSLLGPPMSTAPSLSANFMEMVLPGENLLRVICRQASVQIAPLRTLMNIVSLMSN